GGQSVGCRSSVARRSMVGDAREGGSREPAAHRLAPGQVRPALGPNGRARSPRTVMVVGGLAALGSRAIGLLPGFARATRGRVGGSHHVAVCSMVGPGRCGNEVAGGGAGGGPPRPPHPASTPPRGARPRGRPAPVCLRPGALGGSRWWR